MGTLEDPADHLKHPWQQRPLFQKDLVGIAQLICQDILLAWNELSGQVNGMELGPLNNFAGHVAQHPRDSAPLISQVCHS